MAFLNDRVFDEGLSVLDLEANAVHVTSAEATDYTEATSTYSLGSSSSLSIGAPSDRVGGGRKVSVTAIDDGVITGTGTVTHYALVDTVNSRLLATAALTASQSVTSGNTFTLATFDIGIPDPS
ncbi:hypothetical protein CRP6_gp62 [Roseobacter phage CRP-6]|nr:hypothetical protein CRP6_gp62 [Roseobacter phage CRP-6]